MAAVVGNSSSQEQPSSHCMSPVRKSVVQVQHCAFGLSRRCRRQLQEAQPQESGSRLPFLANHGRGFEIRPTTSWANVSRVQPCSQKKLRSAVKSGRITGTLRHYVRKWGKAKIIKHAGVCSSLSEKQKIKTLQKYKSTTRYTESFLAGGRARRLHLHIYQLRLSHLTWPAHFENLNSN